MPDIRTVWRRDDSLGDWGMAGPSLEDGSDLETAVLISVFTDRAAGPDDVIPDGTADPRGWFGDLGQDRPIGSKVWLRLRSKRTDETLRQVESDLRECLAWMVEDKVAARVEVACSWDGPGFLAALIRISRAADGQAVDLRFAWAWEGL